MALALLLACVRSFFLTAVGGVGATAAAAAEDDRDERLLEEEDERVVTAAGLIRSLSLRLRLLRLSPASDMLVFPPCSCSLGSTPRRQHWLFHEACACVRVGVVLGWFLALCLGHSHHHPAAARVAVQRGGAGDGDFQWLE